MKSYALLNKRKEKTYNMLLMKKTMYTRNSQYAACLGYKPVPSHVLIQFQQCCLWLEEVALGVQHLKALPVI